MLFYRALVKKKFYRALYRAPCRATCIAPCTPPPKLRLTELATLLGPIPRPVECCKVDIRHKQRVSYSSLERIFNIYSSKNISI